MSAGDASRYLYRTFCFILELRCSPALHALLLLIESDIRPVAFLYLFTTHQAALESILRYIAEHHWGELVNIVSLLAQIVGFAVTIAVAVRSKNAAQRAEEAVKKMRGVLQRSDAIMEVTSAIRLMEEIKRLHRNGEWKFLLDRYASLRTSLIGIRSANPNLTDEHKAILTGAITQLRDIESKVEKAVEAQVVPAKVWKLNEIVSAQTDRLAEVLGEIRREVGREDYGNSETSKTGTPAIRKIE